MEHRKMKTNFLKQLLRKHRLISIRIKQNNDQVRRILLRKELTIAMPKLILNHEKILTIQER